jgi:polysaccharide pyruvyl transferase WcaK-like protein
MRLHFLIFAALRGTPFAALPYASKVSGLLDDLGMDTRPLEDIGIGQLIARIDQRWDARDRIRQQIKQRSPLLTSRAGLTSQLLAPMLRHRPETIDPTISLAAREVENAPATAVP